MALIGMGGQNTAGTATVASGDLIRESSLETFAQDVLETSRQVPVIVDFWAPWCGPCKQLGPMLEKLVLAAKGKVRMVKINVDENQEIAQQLRIQSIPTVYAFFGGRPVDAFMGALPESQLKTFIDQLIKSAGTDGSAGIDEVLEAAAAAFADNDIATAAQAYGHVLQEEPGHPKAVAGLAQCYLKSGDLERARSTLQLVSPDKASDEAIRAIEAELTLREQAAKVAGDTQGLRDRLAADANDHQARYDLALALDAAGQREDAIDQLLEIVKRDRAWNEDGARKHLVTIFEAMGPMDKRTIAGRRKLSSLLFS